MHDDPEKEVEETQDIDLEAAQAEISSELFGQGGEEGEDNAPEGEEEQSSEKDPKPDDAAAPSPQSDDEAKAVEGEVVEENSDNVQALGAPKTWNKEELATWATIPDAEKAKLVPILERREADFLNGISQYKGMAERGQAYETVVEPYRPILAAENVDPVQLFQSFASNHYLLSRGTPEQKVQLAANLLSGYNIPLVDLLNHIADSGGEVKPADPEVTALKKEIEELKSGFTARQTQEAEAMMERLGKEIDDFRADKEAHPYFDEVADDITRLFETRQAANLTEAYEKAVYLNPVTRQKEIDRLTAESASKREAEAEEKRKKVADSQADRVKTTPKSRDGTVPTGSMDDTLNETMAAIRSRS